MKCPVCKHTITTENECPCCGFADFQTEFLSEEDALFWQREVVDKYKKEWQNKPTITTPDTSPYNPAHVESSERRHEHKQSSKTGIGVLAGMVLIGIVGMLFWTQHLFPKIQEEKYVEANEYISSGNYDSAIELFYELGDYKDSQDLFQYASQLQKYNAIQLSVVGDIVHFGDYAGESIAWRVLDKDANTALLISEYVIDAQPYNTTASPVTWETCSLRSWLNEQFIAEAFSAEEQDCILSVELENPDTESVDGGNNTIDRVFLLSCDEANNYFTDDDDRDTSNTSYAVRQGAENRLSMCNWWLRSPGGGPAYASEIQSGMIWPYYNNVECINGVRPVICIDLSIGLEGE